jgi:hypothetical protein
MRSALAQKRGLIIEVNDPRSPEHTPRWGASCVLDASDARKEIFSYGL